jgi:hypothetical protein
MALIQNGSNCPFEVKKVLIAILCTILTFDFGCHVFSIGQSLYDTSFVFKDVLKAIP